MPGSISDANGSEIRRLDRYELFFPIARGGMGTVHLARVSGIGGFAREVAIKLVHDHLEGDAERDLLTEARIASRLRHPNVVPVLDVGHAEGRAYIVMEYIEGDSLHGLLRAAPRELGAPLPLAIGLHVVLDSLSGLHAAHELLAEDGSHVALVHRDYSPQNVLVGIDGLARLTDFGVAKLNARTRDATTSGIIKGKLRYMAPEQARAKPLDRRCDIWAAGVVLWELIAEKKLFSGESDAEILLKIVSERAPRLKTVKPDLHPLLDDVVARALEPDANDRFPTALALRKALAEAVRAASLETDRDSVADLVSKVVAGEVTERRRRVAAAVSASSGRISTPALSQPASTDAMPTAATALLGPDTTVPLPRGSNPAIAEAPPGSWGSAQIGADAGDAKERNTTGAHASLSSPRVDPRAARRVGSATSVAGIAIVGGASAIAITALAIGFVVARSSGQATSSGATNGPTHAASAPSAPASASATSIAESTPPAEPRPAAAAANSMPSGPAAVVSFSATASPRPATPKASSSTAKPASPLIMSNPYATKPPR